MITQQESFSLCLATSSALNMASKLAVHGKVMMLEYIGETVAYNTKRRLTNWLLALLGHGLAPALLAFKSLLCHAQKKTHKLCYILQNQFPTFGLRLKLAWGQA